VALVGPRGTLPVNGARDFAAGLRAEHAAFGRFLDLLRSEQQALLRPDVDTLLALARRKTELVDELEHLAGARAGFLAARSLPADRAGMSRWLSGADLAEDSAGLSQIWHELLAMAAEAHQLNRQNGTIIHTRLAHNQQLLAALTAASSRLDLYGPDGQARARPPGRDLGSA
jgi:flagella synthesis protein FlgN